MVFLDDSFLFWTLILSNSCRHRVGFSVVCVGVCFAVVLHRWGIYQCVPGTVPGTWYTREEGRVLLTGDSGIWEDLFC